jgi:hypothetical protein
LTRVFASAHSRSSSLQHSLTAATVLAADLFQLVKNQIFIRSLPRLIRVLPCSSTDADATDAEIASKRRVQFIFHARLHFSKD